MKNKLEQVKLNLYETLIDIFTKHCKEYGDHSVKYLSGCYGCKSIIENIRFVSRDCKPCFYIEYFDINAGKTQMAELFQHDNGISNVNISLDVLVRFCEGLSIGDIKIY